jgi:hypothetical protein
LSEDSPLPEDDAIDAAHPTRSGRHDLYEEAMRLVGARHSKGALVALVNWLLTERDEARGLVEELFSNRNVADSHPAGIRREEALAAAFEAVTRWDAEKKKGAT